jgi:membrane fusion protein, multidrug efflux system
MQMEDKSAQGPGRGRRPFAILAVVALIVIGAVGIWTVSTAGHEDTDDAQVSADLVPVASRVGGQVTKVLIAENQRVKKGDPLLQIDDADYAARVKQAEAELASVKAQAGGADAQAEVAEATSKGGLASAQALFSGSSVGVASADAQVAAARAQVVRAQSDAHRTETDLNRAKELRQANAIPQERLDNAQSAFEAAQAARAQAEAQLAAAQEARRAADARVSEARGRLTQSTPIGAQIAAARAAAELAHARVKSAEAALELAKNQLSYTRIAAPADGIASKLSAHEGQLLAPGQPVVELVPTATYIIANFKETQVGRMKAGQPAEIKVDALPGKRLKGRVESLAGGTGSSFSLLPADNASGNFVKVVQRVPVRIAWVDSTEGLGLLAGLSADVTVDVGK